MEKFSFKRFFRVLNWFLRTNSKQLLMWFAGAATCVFLMQMIVTCTGVVVKSSGGNTYTMGFTPESLAVCPVGSVPSVEQETEGHLVPDAAGSEQGKILGAARLRDSGLDLVPLLRLCGG